MEKMKIAILGTRGIPNYYGGFEQFAEYFAAHLADKGHEVYVYNSHNHPYQEETFKGAHILHKYDPEYKLGTFGQFVYDFNCIRDLRKRKFDIILQCFLHSGNGKSFFIQLVTSQAPISEKVDNDSLIFSAGIGNGGFTVGFPLGFIDADFIGTTQRSE